MILQLQLDKARTSKANLKVYISTGINVIGPYVLYHLHVYNKPANASYFNAADFKGNLLLSCADTLVLGFKLDSKLCSGAKIAISQADRSDVFSLSRKTHDSRAQQPVNKSQPNASNQEIILPRHI